MITKIQKGHPQEVREKRIMRIQEAISFEKGTQEEPKIHVIGMVNDNKIYFSKPGKEVARKKSNNPNDMSPNVGEIFSRYSFGDLWGDLLELSLHISEDSYKQLNVILYRLAYLMDCSIINHQVRFKPTGEVYDTILKIQKEIEAKGQAFKVLEFLNFVDILSWNEDVKYQADCKFENYRKGRINNILSLISVPFTFKKFIDLVMESKNDIEHLDCTSLVELADRFAKTRGIQPMTNKELVKHLSPYLSE